MKQLFSTISNSKPSLCILDSIEKDSEKHNVEELVFKYGVDSLSYLSLEGKKRYYIGINITGFIAYVVINNIAICVGNPICFTSDYLQLVNEFKLFCKNNKFKICFCSINSEFSELLNNNGFVISKYGEEALLDLQSYTTAGGKTEKLRQKLRRAEKSGITIVEYIPKLQRDLILEEKIQTLTREWFSQKDGQLTFTLGDLDFENPLDRRFFLALDEKEDVAAILMFSPFNNREGYFLDVMRRKIDSVPGVMEKAIIDAAMKIKSEGGRWISLGLAPLAGIDVHSSKCTMLEKLFHFVFNHGNLSYSFHTLYQYKKKFNPSCWNPRYVAHEKGLSTVKVAYAMAKARNVDSIFKQAVKCIHKFITRYQKLIWKDSKNCSKRLVVNDLETNL